MRQKISLWKYHRIIGDWKYVRDCQSDTADEWLRLFKRDEPGEHFKLGKNRPTGKP